MIQTMSQLLPLFRSPDVPDKGRDEQPDNVPYWQTSSLETDPSYPGGGLRRYPMLYIGEGSNTMYLVDEGKVIWSYCTGTGWEYDDIWMLSNGHILFSRMGWAGEVTPDKKLVWRVDAQEGTEIHSVQPVGLDRVFMVINAPRPLVKIINKITGAVEYEHEIPFGDPGDVHTQFRRGRITAQGTILLPFLSRGKVVEYDKDFNELWSYNIRSPWAAIRLRNGNTLITNEHDQLTREVAPDGSTVWEIKLSDLPEPYRLNDSQSCVRLRNGHTILCSRGKDGAMPQLVEVTPDKQVVWVINDWKNFENCKCKLDTRTVEISS